MELEEAKYYVESKALRVVDRVYREDPRNSGLVLSQLAGLVEITVGIRDPREDEVKRMVRRMRDSGPLNRDGFILFVTMLSVPGFNLMMQYWDDAT